MKPTTLIPLVACAIALAIGTAWGAPPASWQETSQHRLLKLDLQEAAQHARNLHFEAQHGLTRSRVIVRRHLDDLGSNLLGIEYEIEAIQTIDGEDGFDFHIADIANHAGLAREAYTELCAEAANEIPSADRIAARTAFIYDQMTKAARHAASSASSHRVTEAPVPALHE